MSNRHVVGFCPMGCGETLSITAGGHVVCSRSGCARKYAANEILNDSETEHLVRFGPNEFAVRHPLRERVQNALMDCDLDHHIAALAGPPVRPGRYRAREDGDRWSWEALDA